MSYQPIDPAAFAPTTHTHAADDVTAGVFPIARLTVDTPDGTKFLKDDSTLATPPTGGPGGVPDDGSVTAAKLDATDAVNLRSTLGLGALAVRNDVRLNQAEVTGPLPFSKLTASTVGSVLLGRGGASGAGDFQEIALGTNLSMSGTTLNAAAGGGGGAPTTATYITQTADAGLSAEQALSSLSTGLVKVTTGTGVLSTASAGTDYAAASHNHAGSEITSGTVGTARLGSGSATGSTFLRGDSTWASVTASITSEQMLLGADVGLPSSNAWVLALETTTTFSAGTYLLLGRITFNRAATTARTYQARLTDGTPTAIYASTSIYMPSVNPSSASLDLSAIAVIPALSSWKFRLYGLSSAGSASDLMKAALATNGQGNNATSLVVVKLA